MGFYGNITNTGRTHFQFDKIFENRRAMDVACLAGTDNVFAGRFVLVSYDPEARFTAGDILSGFQVGNQIYADASHTIKFYYTNFQQVQPSAANANNWNKYYWKFENYYIKLPGENYYNAADGSAGNYWTPTVADANDDNKCFVTEGQLIRLYNSENVPSETFLICQQGVDNEVATWAPIILDQNYSNYLINYNIDKEYYGVDQALRGYDGTVWQKIYSEGKGKFILIARLNSLMPGLELFPDAPSVLPNAPYIDSKSSEALYRIHVPSQWGFRIKEVQPIIGEQGIYVYPLSDQVITRTKGIYGPNNELIRTEEEQINAAIYFNKEAGNKLFKYYDDTTVNKIDITPTGKSGKKYFDRDGNQVEIDTYELSVHLPMVGNMISDGYDLIYGENEEDLETGLTTRPTDVRWYSGDSSDELKYNGNSALGGKTHSLETLAGSLNTIHDIMGQIVIDLESWPTEEQINSLAPQYLYRFNGIYYRKGYVLDKTIIPSSAYTYIQQTNVTQEQFIGNKYYYKSGNNYIQATSYDSSYGANGYYLRNINSVRYTPITLIQFQPGRYYLLEGENYLCDNSQNYPMYPDRTYYTVTDDGGRFFTGQYQSDGSFFTLEDGNYVPSTTTEPLINTTYYTVAATPRINGRFYHPGSFYYKEGNNFILATEPQYDSSKTYYVLIFDDTPKYGYNSLGEVVQYYEVIDYEEDILFSSPQGYQLDQLYVLDNETYISYENIQNITPTTNRDPYTIARQYYTLTVQSYASGTLYLPGVYYIKDAQSLNYTKSYENLSREIKYYLINSVTEVEHPFYMPDTYYWKQSQDVYVLSQSDTMTNGRQYYEKSSMYVNNDDTGQCPYGYEWNDYAAYVPPSITLYTAEKKPGLIAISELGKNTNSLYGLLLQLNKMYGPGEEATRDMNTVRGAYNILRDLLYQIKTLRPGYILRVNDFGQIESVSLSDLKTLLNNI